MSDFDDLQDYHGSDSEEDVNDSKTGNISTNKADKDTYTSMHATSFEDLLLCQQLQRSISDRGFEHPSEGMLVEFTLTS